jgi:hypothetical protein
VRLVIRGKKTKNKTNQKHKKQKAKNKNKLTSKHKQTNRKQQYTLHPAYLESAVLKSASESEAFVQTVRHPHPAPAVADGAVIAIGRAQVRQHTCEDDVGVAWRGSEEAVVVADRVGVNLLQGIEAKRFARCSVSFNKY